MHCALPALSLKLPRMLKLLTGVPVTMKELAQILNDTEGSFKKCKRPLFLREMGRSNNLKGHLIISQEVALV